MKSLRHHGLSVEAAMKWYANHFSIPQNEQLLWSLTGLLHDFDYEQYPDCKAPDGHPFVGVKILDDRGYPAEVGRAILGHATYSGTPRDTLMAKTLFAVDELSGLITAAALVRPDKSILNLEVSPVLKRFKDKGFARGCNRDDIVLGAEELGIELRSHCENVLKALQIYAKENEAQ